MSFLSSLRRASLAATLVMGLCVYLSCAYAATFNLTATGDDLGVSSYNKATTGRQGVTLGSDSFFFSTGISSRGTGNGVGFRFTLSGSQPLQQGDVFAVVYGGSVPSASVTQTYDYHTDISIPVTTHTSWTGKSGQITITELSATSITVRFDSVVLMGYGSGPFELNGTLTTATTNPTPTPRPTVTPTATATPEPTATPTPTATATPAPTATPKPTPTAAPLPVVSVNTPTVREGNGGTGTAPSQLVFTLSLSKTSTTPVTVYVQSANAATASAIARSDYLPLGKTRVTFASGQRTQTVPLTLIGDTVYEENERLALALSSPIGATLKSPTAEGIILNDDALPGLSINDVSVIEGNRGYTRATFIISLSNPSDRQISVGYSTYGSGRGVATGGTPTTPNVDYLAIAPTILTFAPGQTSKVIVVFIKGDTLVEGNEIFGVRLSAPVNARIADGIGIGTIQNDDSSTTTAAATADYPSAGAS